jgi:hypothetical protein
MLGDQVARDNEENVDTDVAPREQVRPQMVKNHEADSDSP